MRAVWRPRPGGRWTKASPSVVWMKCVLYSFGWVSFPISCFEWASQFLFPSEKASMWSLPCASSVFVSAAKGLLMLAGVTEWPCGKGSCTSSCPEFFLSCSRKPGQCRRRSDGLSLSQFSEEMVRLLLGFKLNSRWSSSEGSLAEGTEVYQTIQVYSLCLFPCL